MAVAASPGSTMLRDVDWKQVVFVAAGVPALVLFSMGGISEAARVFRSKVLKNAMP